MGFIAGDAGTRRTSVTGLPSGQWVSVPLAMLISSAAVTDFTPLDSFDTRAKSRACTVAAVTASNTANESRIRTRITFVELTKFYAEPGESSALNRYCGRYESHRRCFPQPGCAASGT